MSTNWELVRAMMQSAIDACERIEALDLAENERDAIAEFNGHKFSVFDAMVSAWVYPERLRYQIIRQRHEEGLDQPYVPETARILVNVAHACAELIGAGKAPPGDAECRKMMRWYSEHAVPGIERALQTRRDAD